MPDKNNDKKQEIIMTAGQNSGSPGRADLTFLGNVEIACVWQDFGPKFGKII